ncbi:MAG: hypothetical protein HFJ41_00220 [Clostridia bacterium]|nr:hypothetical protein [Clostridia bacterium]
MKIFIIIVFVAITVIAGIFLRMAWKNYKEEGIILTRYWFNTIPATVTEPFSYGVFLIFMAIMILSTIL